MFESVYDSPWIATFVLAVLAVATYAVWLRRQPFLVGYAGLFTLLAAFDALRSGVWSPLHLLAFAHEDEIGLIFIVLGDLRFLLLLERFATEPTIGPLARTPRAAWRNALLLMAIVPPITFVLSKLNPAMFGARKSYVTYELLFVALTLVLRFVVLPRRLAKATDAVRTWLFEVTYFETALYALWALADVIILAGADAGFLLRIVPNVMYYGLFVAFVVFRAPREHREPHATAEGTR